MSLNSFSFEKKVAVVAPASPVARDRFERGVNNLKDRGYDVTVFGNICQDSSPKEALFCSDLEERRIGALYKAFDAAPIIWAAKGGYGAMELLPSLDFSQLNTKGKAFIGFSDITALHAALYKEKKDCLLIHGPTIESGWSKEQSDGEAKRSVDLVLELLESSSKVLLNGATLQTLGDNDDVIEGELIGGNLSMISSLLGTPWEIDLKNKILFFEEIGEKPYRIHRLLMQLKIAGKLEGLRGVLIGHLTACEHPQGIGASAEESISNIFKSFNFPVYIGGPFGHVPQNYPLPLAQLVRISRQGCVLADV